MKLLMMLAILAVTIYTVKPYSDEQIDKFAAKLTPEKAAKLQIYLNNDAAVAKLQRVNPKKVETLKRLMAAYYQRQRAIADMRDQSENPTGNGNPLDLSNLQGLLAKLGPLGAILKSILGGIGKGNGMPGDMEPGMPSNPAPGMPSNPAPGMPGYPGPDMPSPGTNGGLLGGLLGPLLGTAADGKGLLGALLGPNKPLANLLKGLLPGLLGGTSQVGKIVAGLLSKLQAVSGLLNSLGLLATVKNILNNVGLYNLSTSL